jgi:ribulose-bisphosphate carboxylase large chain
MVNVFVAGFDALKALASDPSINVPIHTHRCMHDLFTSRGNYGVAPSVFAEIARMCGADFYHVGTPIGKPQKALAEMREAHASLTRSMGRFAPTVPVSSRVSPLSVANVLTAFDSTQLLLLACGAIYRLPYPVATGVAAIADALEAAALQQEASSEAYQQSTSYLTALSRAPNSREQ